MTPFASRGLALLLLVGALAVGWAGLLQPVLAWADRGEELAAVRDSLARYGRAAAYAPLYAAALQQGGSAPAEAYLTEPNDTLATAALQAQLARLATAARLDLRSAQPQPGTDEAGRRRLAVTVGFDGPFDAVIRFLHALEAERPLLFVGELEILATALADLPGQPPVSGRLTVAAFRRSGS